MTGTSTSGPMTASKAAPEMNYPAASSGISKGKYAPRGGELDPTLSRRFAFGIIRPASSSSSRFIGIPVAWVSLMQKTAMAITKLKTCSLKQQQRNTYYSQDKPDGIFFPTDQVGDGNGKNCPCLPADERMKSK